MADFNAAGAIQIKLRQEPSGLDGREIVKTLRVERVEVKNARGYIAEFHYSHCMPDSTLHVFRAAYGKELAGFCVFGMGCGMSQYRSLVPEIENGEFCELTRLWCFDKAPKNTESRFISTALRLLPKRIKLVLSYSDMRQNHTGGIYKASGWVRAGTTNGGKILIDGTGKEFHPRLLEMYRKRHPDTYGRLNKSELMDTLKFREIAAGKKYRFLKLLNGAEKDFRFHNLMRQWCNQAQPASSRQEKI